MKRSLAFIMAIFAALLLAGCGGKGSSAPAPSNFHVVAGDTSATVTWDMQPGVEYWIFKAAGTKITPQSCSSMPECTTTGVTSGATSPTVITGLTNGTQYSFTIDGRISGGPGGPGSASQSVTPRLAGTTWTTPITNTVANTNDLHGVAYGIVASTYYFVAAGNDGSGNGALFSSIDGMSWTALTMPTPAVGRLNAVTYYNGSFVAVGAGGAILRSTDLTTWTSENSQTSNELLAISNYGTYGIVAAGASGTVRYSSDGGVTWIIVSPPTANSLYGITYGNGYYVAVGAAGTLLTSTNLTTWTTVALTAYDLKGVTYGVPQYAYNSTYTSLNLPPARFIAVGANGTVVTSTDGANWSTSTPISSTLLNAVTFGHQFVAVDNVGNIYTSPDGTNVPWSAQSSVPATPLYGVTPAILSSGQYIGQFTYSIVGASGVNMVGN